MLLKKFWPIPTQNQKDYKMLLARYDHQATRIYNSKHEPLNSWVKNKWKPIPTFNAKIGGTVFHNNYIFSLVNFYHDKSGRTWIFSGLYDVVSRPKGGMHPNNQYQVRLNPKNQNLVGRLVVYLLPQYKVIKNVRANLESQYHKFEVQGILNQPYHGQTTLQFP